MPKILIVFATLEEAVAVIEKLSAKAVTSYRFVFDSGTILVTGIGPFATACALEKYYSGEGCIINIGLAGALCSKYLIGTLYPIVLCKKRVWHPRGSLAVQRSAAYALFENIELPLFSSCPLSDDGAVLITTDIPAYGADALGADLVDMEGYAVARFAQQRAVTCYLYKIVSDYCSEKSSQEIQKRMPQLVEAIAAFTQKIVILHSRCV